MGPVEFSVSERAAARIVALTPPGQARSLLRVAVDGGGCGGFSYRFALEHTQQPEDLVIDRGAARVVIDRTSFALLAGAQLDYTEDLISSHFTVRNPNATSSCGCGSSFSVD